MARNLTWECTNKGAAENRDADQAADQEQPQDNSKWEGKSDKKDNVGEQRTTSLGWMLLRHLKVTKLLMRMIIKLLLSIIRIGLLARFVAFSIMRLKTVEGCTMKSVD
jgi:hypothetical protein